MDCITSLKKSEIGIQWKKFLSTLAKDSNTASVQRLIFILSHYQMWIKKAAQNALNTETEVTCMQELMDLLQDYSRSSMMDDFHDVKKMMDKETENDVENENENGMNDEKKNNNNNNSSTNNNLSSNKVKSATVEYFHSKLGKCNTNFSNCKCFVRNRRLPSSDTIENERRATFYIRIQDVQKYTTDNLSRFEVREVILQSSLDVIHNYIFHAEDEQMNVNESHKNKFVTEMEVPNDRKSNDQNVNSSKNDQKAKKIGQYAFGCDMYYWLSYDPYFVPAKYPDMKTELLSNALFAIALFTYEELEERARDILKTKYGKSLLSKRVHDWMRINNIQLIPKGTLITDRHLIAVLAYTNNGKMQYEFKKQGFRKMSDDETDADVRKRNSEIAHWSRAVCEVVNCWGSVISHKKPLYHGIDCKLLFNRLSQIFSMPTSLTTSMRVAQNFAKDGIILVLKHAGESDVQSLMFDVSIISDYPNEQERLVFRSSLQFFDILTAGGYSVKQWIKVLKFYQRIRYGRFLSHLPFSAIQQQMLVCMIENYLKESKNKNEKYVEFYENGNIPNYIQQLFGECTKSECYIPLNVYSITRAITNKKLAHFLDGNGKNSEFLNIFPGFHETFVYEWLITGEAYDLYFSDDHPWVVGQQTYNVNVALESNAQPIYLTFHWELQNNARDNLLQCRLNCNQFPAEVDEMNINVGIFIEVTNSEKYSGSYLHQQKLYSLVLHSVIESNLLLVENNSKMKQNEFMIKVLFSPRQIRFNV